MPGVWCTCTHLQLAHIKSMEVTRRGHVMICIKEREKMSAIGPIDNKLFSYLEMIGVSRMEDLQDYDVQGMLDEMQNVMGAEMDRRVVPTLRNLVSCAHDLG